MISECTQGSAERRRRRRSRQNRLAAEKGQGRKHVAVVTKIPMHCDSGGGWDGMQPIQGPETTFTNCIGFCIITIK